MKTLKLKYGLLIAGLFFSADLFSQANRKSLDEIAEPASRSNWIYFKAEKQLNAQTIFENYKVQFGLSADDRLEKIKSYTNPLSGITQHRFQQYFNNIPVHGAVMCVYEKDGIAYKANGRIVHDMQPARSSLNETDALQKAFDYLPAKDYAWLDAKSEERFRVNKNDQTASQYPKGELMYMYEKPMKNFSANDYRLCYKFDVWMNRSTSYSVFINAQTGEVVNTLPLTMDCNSATTQTPMNGTRSISTSVQGGCTNPASFELYNDCRGFPTYIIVEDDNYGSGSEPICTPGTTNTWSNPTGIRGDGVQVFWGMNETFNYYNSHFTWESYNDGGATVLCYVAYEFTDKQGNPTGQNAQFSGSEFRFGNGISGTSALDSYTCLDVVAHEYTHGVDAYTANLDYSNQSGALNESFSDIFGELVEIETDPGIDPTPWLVAEDKGSAIRSFADPSLHDQPDTYLGGNWQDYTSNTDDNGGVHVNSGVQNFMFYLLAAGGNGYNDHSDRYDVSPLSIPDIRDIAFTALTYLWNSAEYLDARDAWLEAASDLFGNCSNQMIQVGNAWRAVGVGESSPYFSTFVTGTLTAVTANKTYEAIDNVYSLALTNVNSISGAKEVRLYSGREVTLNPGFTAQSGTAFRAKINPCSVTLHSPIRNANPTVANENGSMNSSNLTSSLSIVPNPFTDLFVCRFNSTDDESQGTISVFDALGKLVLNSPCSIEKGLNEFNLDATVMQPGLYNLVLNTKSGKMYSQKIVKQ